MDQQVTELLSHGITENIFMSELPLTTVFVVFVYCCIDRCHVDCMLTMFCPELKTDKIRTPFQRCQEISS